MSADQPLPFSPAVSTRRWLVTLHDNTVRVVQAVTFRVEGGALVLAMPAGCAAAYAAGTWHRIEPEATP